MEGARLRERGGKGGMGECVYKEHRKQNDAMNAEISCREAGRRMNPVDRDEGKGSCIVAVISMRSATSSIYLDLASSLAAYAPAHSSEARRRIASTMGSEEEFGGMCAGVEGITGLEQRAVKRGRKLGEKKKDVHACALCQDA